MVSKISIAKSAGSQSETGPVVFADYQPNILDNYSLPTYHFRLYMMGEQAIQTGNYGPTSKDQRIIIAESGATTIGIDDVTIYSTSSISKEAGVGVSTNFSMKLRQPFGATLVDEIFKGAQSLGISNFAKVPVFLELSFRARKSADNSDEGPVTDDVLNNIIWVWPIFFNKMSIDVNAGGSTYDLDASLYGDIAYTNQAADLEKVTNVKATTVAEFFDGLEKQLNLKETQKKATKETVFDKYEFYIDKEIADAKIVPSMAEDVANRAADFSVASPAKNEFVFQAGTSIDRIVETILSTTTYFQKKGKGTDNKDALSQKGKGDQAAIQTLYRLIADTKLGEFDPGRNDYSRTYRYLIIPYEMTTIQTKSNSESGLTSQQRYDLIRNRGRLQKVYNYIYTGLNDQVFDFDLVFNFNWYAALPFQSGITTNASSSEPDASVPRETPEQVIKQKDSQTVTMDAAHKPSKDHLIIDQIIADATKVTTSTLSSNSVAGINNGLEDQLNGLTNQLVASAVARQSRIAAIKNKKTTSSLKSVSPTVEDQSKGEAETNAIASNVSYLESMPGVDQMISGDYSSSPGKTLLSTMFEQAKSPESADLLNINLSIKGDPFWLEPAPIGRNSNLQSAFDRELAKYNLEAQPGGGVSVVQSDTQGTFHSNNSSANQTYMLFRSFTPQNYDPETGLMPKPTPNNVLNGVYAVRKVEHNFSNGKFTQTLQAIREPQISLEHVDLKFGVADTRQSITEQYGIDLSIDSPTVKDNLTEQQKEQWYNTQGGAAGGAMNA